MSWVVPLALQDYRSSEDPVLREGHLELMQACNVLVPCMITLTRHYFIYAVNGTEEVVISWDHVVGCHCLRGRHGNGRSAYFCLYTYPPVQKKKFGKVCRHLLVTFAVDLHATFQENMQLAKTWQTSILECMTQALPTERRLRNPERPYLVLVNRKSGPGRAFAIFEKSVNPVFAASDVPYELLLTERRNHARELMRTFNPELYRGVVIVSGDGLVFEVLNGLFERPDWEQAVSQVPIGVVPGGSGNGLAASLLHACGLSMVDNLHEHSALLLVKPTMQSMDVVLVETAAARFVSFLSITWAMIADIDIQSERLRSLGGARFTVAALAKILGSRVYRGKISFLPCEPYDPVEQAPLQRRTSQPKSPRNTAVVGALNGRRGHQSESALNNNSCYDGQDRLDDDVFSDNLRFRSYSGACGDLDSVEESDEQSPHLDDVDNRPRPAPHFTLDDDDDTSGANNNNNGSGSGSGSGVDNYGVTVPRSFLPPLTAPVPEDWVTITDDFLVFCAAYQTHIATDAYILPPASINDGVIHLVLIRSGVPRSALFGIMSSIESGQHTASPYVEMIAVKAFRLEPLTPDGIISVDGERVDYGPIQAEVLEQKVPVVMGCTMVNNSRTRTVSRRRTTAD